MNTETTPVLDRHTKTGVVIGRFQVPDIKMHPGYVSLLNDVAAKSDRVIVLLGSAPVDSKKNALRYFHRKAMFNEYDSSIEVYEIKDVLGNDVWTNNLDKLIASVTNELTETVTLYGSRDSFIETYVANNGKYNTEYLTECDMHSATLIRMQIKDSTESNKYIRMGIIQAMMNQYNKAFSTVDAILHRINPITLEREYLLGQKYAEVGSGKWRFPGGFFDVGEKRSVHAVSREVAEETLLQIPSRRFRIVTDIEVNDWRMWGTGDSIKTMICESFVEYDAAYPTDSEHKGGDDLPVIKWVIESEVTQLIQDVHAPIWEDFKEYQVEVLNQIPSTK